MLGPKNPRWNGGRSTSGDGRIAILIPDHPYANSRGYVYESRLIMEKHIGRYLLPSERIHHINNNKFDNRIENLKIVSFKEHAQVHHGLYPQLYDRDWLYQQYVVQGKYGAQIAREIGCHKGTAEFHIRRFGFPKHPRPRKYPQLHDKEWMRSHRKTMSCRQISELLNCDLSIVFEAARRFA